MSVHPRRAPLSPDAERATVVTDASAALEARFAQIPPEHVERLAREEYDAIVAPGVTIHAYLRNLVVHRARGRLEEERTGPRAAPGTAVTADPPGSEPDSRPIVVGFDGSPASESALDRALLVAGSLGAPVRVVGAWQYPPGGERFPLAGWTPAADLQALVDASLAVRFGSATPPRLTTRIVEGPAARVLLDESRSAQMLVVGSRGHGGFVGLLLGSVSAACAERAECPVLVMHAPRVEHEDPVSAGAEALGDGSRASDAPVWAGGA